MGSLSLLQGIFPTQILNPGLPHCSWILYCLSHQGSPRILEWVVRSGDPDPLLQGIFLTQKSNCGLLHCRQILYQLSYQGSPVSNQEPVIIATFIFPTCFLSPFGGLFGGTLVLTLHGLGGPILVLAPHTSPSMDILSRLHSPLSPLHILASFSSSPSPWSCRAAPTNIPTSSQLSNPRWRSPVSQSQHHFWRRVLGPAWIPDPSVNQSITMIQGTGPLIGQLQSYLTSWLQAGLKYYFKTSLSVI